MHAASPPSFEDRPTRRRFLRLVHALTLLLTTHSFVLGLGCHDAEPQRGGCPEGYVRASTRSCVLAPDPMGTPPSPIEPDVVDPGDGRPPQLPPGSAFDGSSDGSLGGPPDVGDDLSVDTGTGTDGGCVGFAGSAEFVEVFANPQGSDGPNEYVTIRLHADQIAPIQLEAFNGDDATPYLTHALSREALDELVASSSPEPPDAADPIDPEPGPALRCSAAPSFDDPGICVQFTVGDTHGDVPFACERASGCLQNGPDRLRLVDCRGRTIGELSYPSIPSGTSYRQCELAESEDFGEFGLSEPATERGLGAFHDEAFCAPRCTIEQTESLRIEQFMIFPATGTDARGFIVVSRLGDGTEAVVSLNGVNEDESVAWLSERVTLAPVPEQRVLFGGTAIPDRTYPLVPLHPASDASSLTLLGCGAEPLDSVRWGDSTADGSEGFASPLPAPFEGELWMRCSDTLWWSLLVDDEHGPLTEGQQRSHCADAYPSATP